MLHRHAAAAAALILVLLAAGCGDAEATDSSGAPVSSAPGATSSAPSELGEHYATAAELVGAVGCTLTYPDIATLVRGSVSAAACTGTSGQEITAAIFGTFTDATAYASSALQVAKAARTFVVGENWILRCQADADCYEAQQKVGGQRLGG